MLLDRLLCRWRFRVAARHIPRGARVLDIGTSDGAFLNWLGPRIGPSVGVDPLTEARVLTNGHRVVRGSVEAASDEGPFDCCTALAVLEHLDTDSLKAISEDLLTLSSGGAILIATVPSPVVDGILAVLMRLRLLRGMETEQHHGVEVSDIVETCEQTGWSLQVKRRFQLGLNNVLVFRST